jgi:hypothetical protein
MVLSNIWDVINNAETNTFIMSFGEHEYKLYLGFYLEVKSLGQWVFSALVDIIKQEVHLYNVLANKIQTQSPCS